MKLNFALLGLFVVMLQPASAETASTQQLATQCYQEWQSRGWRLGEDGTLAANIPAFKNGIETLCEVRADMAQTDPTVSPFVEGTMPELAPYMFTGNKADMKVLVEKLKHRKPGYAGQFMRD
jgi:hypothetical protein